MSLHFHTNHDHPEVHCPLWGLLKDGTYVAVELEPVEGNENLPLANPVVVGQLVWSDKTRSRFENWVVHHMQGHRIHQNSFN